MDRKKEEREGGKKEGGKREGGKREGGREDRKGKGNEEGERRPGLVSGD